MRMRSWNITANAVLCVASVAPATGLLAQQAVPLVVFTHVTVLTMSDSPSLVDQSVVIRGSRIVGLGPSATLDVPAGSRVVAANGKFLLPGLWDMHAHLPDDSTTRSLMFPLYLANGVTGLRDMWGDCESICAGTDSAGVAPPASVVRTWKHDIAAGTLLGPRLVVAGNALRGAKPPPFPGTHAVRDSADAIAAVRHAKEQGADFIKVIGDILPEAYFRSSGPRARTGCRLRGTCRPV